MVRRNLGLPHRLISKNFNCVIWVYTWTGQLNPGEFKFTKFNSNWCDGTEIIAETANQTIANTAFKLRDNCQGDDNKWKVSASGTYTITLNLDTNSLEIK